MSKGSKEILELNKRFESKCKNNLAICKLIYQKDREYIALKAYWVFLFIYSTLGLILMYKPFKSGQSYFSTLVMFLLPLMADIFNTKIYHNLIKVLRIAQLVVLGIMSLVCFVALFGGNIIFKNNIITLNKPFPIVSFNTDIVWYVLLVIILSLASNIVGAKSPLDRYLEEQNELNNTVTV